MIRFPPRASSIRWSFYAGGGAAIGLLATTGTLVEALPVRAPTLCVAGETTIFACPIGRRSVAVCGSGKQAIYRYGRPGQIEITSTRVTMAATGFSGGGERQFSAINGDYTYTVYDRTVRTGFRANGPNNPEFTSGLVVRANAKTLSSRTCDKASTGTASAGFVVPEGAFVDHD